MMKIRTHIYKVIVSFGLLFGLSGCIMNAFSSTHTTIEEMTENEYKAFKKDFTLFAQTINYSCENIDGYYFYDNVNIDITCKYDLKKYGPPIDPYNVTSFESIDIGRKNKIVHIGTGSSWAGIFSAPSPYVNREHEYVDEKLLDFLSKYKSVYKIDSILHFGSGGKETKKLEIK
ncbi:hypothetical protein [Sulfurovum mangrovi]|uniref:hypothetical protein n=1 Tax=Sulfurovum mangrovi TaxID=2893889 RepID=UPI001E5BB8FC|nr:hypothetical protein [Sulfurovum mangrovi]UFH60179.1 hypothetical protein LN246_04855 [Sulfurovum mangrovi]